jgi:hypothetical protein
MYGAAMSRAESVRFDRLLNHVRHVVAGAEMLSRGAEGKS